MKKSNRWLMWSLLTVILGVIGANLLLFRQYHLGHVSSLVQEQSARHSYFRIPPVHRLVLDGTVWVNIIPADSNVISIPKTLADPDDGNPVIFGPGVFDLSGERPQFHVSGDTLFVQGSNNQSLHRPYADWFYRTGIQQIDVYVSSLEYIRIINGQVLLKGRRHLKPGTSITLEAAGATVWLGEMDARPKGSVPHKILPDELFDTISLQVSNTVILLNRPAMIANLHARLDSLSEINDNGATLGRCRISASPDSRVSFAGAALSKTTIITE